MGFDLKRAFETKEFIDDINRRVGASISTLEKKEGKLQPAKKLIAYKEIEENPTTYELKFSVDTNDFLGGLVLKIKKSITTSDECKIAIITGINNLLIKKISRTIGKEILDATLNDRITYRPVFIDKVLHFKVMKTAVPSNIIKLLKASDFEEDKVQQLLKIFNVSLPHVREYMEFLKIIKAQEKVGKLIKIEDDLKSSISDKNKTIKKNLFGDISSMGVAFWREYCELTKSVTTGETKEMLNRVIGGILLKNKEYPGGKVVEQVANILKTYPALLIKRANYTNPHSKLFLGKMMRKKTETFYIMKFSDSTLYKNLLFNSLTDGDKAALKTQVDALIKLVNSKLDAYTKYLEKRFEGKKLKPLVKEINFLTNELNIKYVEKNNNLKELVIKLNMAS